MMKFKNAFTLVELIVVITILAILGTIAFISLQGYSSNARDSVRTSDISKIKTSLELFYLGGSKYPEVTGINQITYSGSLAWTQGTFGMDSFINVGKLDKIPKDPLTNREYTYSTTNTKQEYEVAGLMESDNISIVNQSYTALKKATLKITGNYNGKILKVPVSSITYILAVPSIITSNGFDLENIVSNDYFAYNGYQNLPESYSGTSYNVLGDPGLNFVEDSSFIIFSGSLSDLSNSEQIGIDARADLISNLQDAYTGTVISHIGEINEILVVSGVEGIESLASTIVRNDLGGTIISGGQTSELSCDSNPNYIINTNTYNIPIINSGNSQTINTDIVENNGSYRYSIDATCNNGVLSYSSETGPILQSCNSGYFINGNSCEIQWSGDLTVGQIFKNTSGIDYYPISCNNLLTDTNFQVDTLGGPWDGSNFSSGIYYIKPDSNSAFKAYCDMTTDGGGWTLLFANEIGNYRYGSSFYSGTLGVSHNFTFKTKTLNAADMEKINKNVGFTELIFKSDTGGEFSKFLSSTSTPFTTKKANSDSWSFVSGTYMCGGNNLFWNRVYSGSYTKTHVELGCYTITGYGDQLYYGIGALSLQNGGLACVEGVLCNADITVGYAAHRGSFRHGEVYIR